MNQGATGNSDNKKKFWTGVLIGLGFGAVGGGIGGYCYATKKERKRARDEIRRARRHYYEKGRHDMQEYGRKSCEELFQNNPELAKEFEKTFCGSDEKMSEDKNEENAEPSSVVVSEATPAELNEAWRGYRENGENLEFLTEDGGMIVAPRKLFFDEKGESVGVSRIRVNLREYFRMDQKTLAKLWRILGYGYYEPDIENMDAYVSNEELTDMETIADGLDIDEIDDAGTEERNEERSVYMDQLERYKQHPEEGFRICSEREFKQSTRLDQRQVDYYDVDNVFAFSDELATQLDSWELFGVGNGNDLFGKVRFDDEDEVNDPDIVYGINFKHNLAVEVTRYHKSYAGVQDGSAYI